ncbi:MAG TPA: D-aminoacylase [Thermoleophilia bacterium]|nr:D-aminoacylase [Thermoleophilia bacterium]HQG53887.1 D-aminoacylase [Thermoleophilia bacterium]HQJ97462.1 D-aminoacylase [Thermoleophilia bacterium]
MAVFDIVVADGRIVDGCGNPWYRGDLGIRGRRVAAVAPPGTLRGRRIIDAGDRYVTPGFVDPHTHSDISIIAYPRAESAVFQGVTTHVTGNCGMGAAPVTDRFRAEARAEWEYYWSVDVDWSWRSFAQYLRAVEARGTAINIAPLVGHGALRIAAMGNAERRATSREIAVMCRLLERSMRAGAHGLSTGLVYPPGCFAATDEIVALCEVVAKYHGIYTSHIRGERETILDAVREAIAIGRAAGVPVEVSHNAPKWGAGPEAKANLELVEEARRAGQDVTVDNDSHTDLAPRLSRALPQTFLGLPHERLMALLADPEQRPNVRRAVESDTPPGAGYAGLVKHGRFDRIVVLYAPNQPHLRGQTVAKIAAVRGADPFDTFLDLIVEEDDRVVGIFDYIDEAEIRRVLTHPLTMVCSDGFVMPPAEGLDDPALYWPCSYGEYPGILERYVRDEPVLRLEEAVRKMTSFPAQRFGLTDRGALRPGLAADVLVFDLERLRDRATNPYPHSYPFVNIPHAYAEGMDLVLVNGVVVIDEGRHTGELPGRVLRHHGR